MSNSVQAVHAVNAHSQASPTNNQPPKAAATNAQNSAPQDKVTISSSAHQALAKAAASHDVEHGGDSH